MFQKQINTNKTAAVSMAFAVSGIGMIIGGAFLDAMTKDALILTGAAVAVLALSSLMMCSINNKRKKNTNIGDISIGNLILLAAASIPGLCLGYGAVHIGITPLLQEAALDLAATIGIKCAISGVLGFALVYIAALCHASGTYKEEFCMVKNNLLCATSVAFGSMAATVLPEIISNAVGVQGDAAIAFEVLIGAAVMTAVVSAFYAVAACYNAYHHLAGYEKVV